MFGKAQRFPFGRPTPAIPLAQRRFDLDPRWTAEREDKSEREPRGGIARALRRPFRLRRTAGGRD